MSARAGGRREAEDGQGEENARSAEGNLDAGGDLDRQGRGARTGAGDRAARRREALDGPSREDRVYLSGRGPVTGVSPFPAAAGYRERTTRSSIGGTIPCGKPDANPPKPRRLGDALVVVDAAAQVLLSVGTRG